MRIIMTNTEAKITLSNLLAANVSIEADPSAKKQLNESEKGFFSKTMIDLLVAFQGNNKLETIKQVRTLLDLNLADAKQIVDRMWEDRAFMSFLTKE